MPFVLVAEARFRQMQVEIHIKVKGRVQGVGFRYATQQAATEQNLGGWVRNTAEGDVEIQASGTEEAVERFLSWCHEGPSTAKVSEVEILSRRSVDQSTENFSIRY